MFCEMQTDGGGRLARCVGLQCSVETDESNSRVSDVVGRPGISDGCSRWYR